MRKLLSIFVFLILLLPTIAHSNNRVSLDSEESVKFVGNIRAFVADVLNDHYIDGSSEHWNGIDVMISLPKKFQGKRITILYKNAPTTKGGVRLELGDYLQFSTNTTDSLYLHSLSTLHKISEDKWVHLYNKEGAKKEK